jgi:hypothetical protein
MRLAYSFDDYTSQRVAEEDDRSLINTSELYIHQPLSMNRLRMR